MRLTPKLWPGHAFTWIHKTKLLQENKSQKHNDKQESNNWKHDNQDSKLNFLRGDKYVSNYGPQTHVRPKASFGSADSCRSHDWGVLVSIFRD